MAEEQRDTEKNGGGQQQSGGTNQAGDPGRTPGSAEGDRETVEQDLRNKEQGSSGGK
jgi:hypothetical protein